jgi:hypothetical protein
VRVGDVGGGRTLGQVLVDVHEQGHDDTPRLGRLFRRLGEV